MKHLLQTAAQTLVETTLAHPHADCGCLCDAAIQYLRGCGCTSGDLKRLPSVVARELHMSGVRQASLLTPSGESGHHRQNIVGALERSLNARIELFEQKDAALIGGATLRVGDDVLDRSVAGALQSFSHHLT